MKNNNKLICDLCGKDKGVGHHHLTYIRQGKEKSRDTTPLCRGCHLRYHKEVAYLKSKLSKFFDKAMRYCYDATALEFILKQIKNNIVYYTGKENHHNELKQLKQWKKENDELNKECEKYEKEYEKYEKGNK